MRFNDTLDVNFNVELNQDNINIAPMLLLPFVENSFKHGHIVEGLLKIKIDVTVASDSLLFIIENTSKESQSPAHGLGLDNIKKRLELLYPNSHELHFFNKNNNFKVILNLKSLSHEY